MNVGGRSLEGIAHPQVDQVMLTMTEPCLTLFADGLTYFFIENTSVWEIR
jgi:hypothetical protein